MFYDLNVPWSPNDVNLPRTLAFLHELGYNVVALNHTISGKLPNNLQNPIPTSPPPSTPAKLTLLRRVTLILTESYQNARLAALAREYDLLALRPVDERTLQLACNSLDCDIISLDLTQRFPFYFRHNMLAEAVRAGKRVEICYAQGLRGDPQARRNLIANATQLIRACRGRGVVLSSESGVGAVGCRGPWDVVNLAAVWGLGSERGVEAVGREARAVVVAGKMKRTGYRGAVDVVYGGEKTVRSVDEGAKGGSKGERGQKRKADVVESRDVTTNGEATSAPISKREAKRRAKRASLAAGANASEGIAAESGPSAQSGSTEKG